MNHEAFLTAIRETPDDDAPRLVQADWLEDQGEPERAAFIRALCAAARLPEWSAEREQAEEDAAQLFIAHATRWLGEVPAEFDNSLYERGFWSRLSFDAAVYLEAVERRPLHLLAPVQTVRLHAVGDRLDDLLACPALEWVDFLEIEDSRIDDEAASKIARSPHLHQLRRLHLNGQSLTARGVAALLAEDGLPSLTGLSLSLARLGDGGLREMARLPGLARLKRLSLTASGFGSAGAAALVKSRYLGELEELELGCLNFSEQHTRIGNTALEAMSRPRRLPSLRTLILHQAEADPPTWRTLACSPLAGRLRQLEVNHTTFTEADVEALFHNGRLNLEALRLGVFEMSLAALAVLLRSSALRSVRKLDLAGTFGRARGAERLALEGAGLLARASPFEQLRELYLSWNKLGDAGIEALAGADSLPALRSLYLYGNGIGPAGAESLAKSRSLDRITRLMIANNLLGDEGVAALERARFAGCLRFLSLGGNRLTPDAIVRLARSMAFSGLRQLHLGETRLETKGAREIIKSPLFASLQNLTLDPSDIPERQVQKFRSHFGARLYLLIGADYA